MGTRSGVIDPAIIPYIMDKEHLSIKEVDKLLNKESGVLGISGISSDFRDLSKEAEEGNERVKLALDMFVYSVKRYLGFYACAMGGVDAVVFTAGIGENNGAIRAAIMEGMEFLGAAIDLEKNKGRGEIDISAEGAKVKTLVIPTNEELMIALDTKLLVAGK